MIQHTVVFRLRDDVGVDAFLDRARRLASIPGVHDFEVLRQISDHSDFTHALSMRFEGQADYDAYNVHPAHVEFVNDVWIPDVAAFVELDYVPAPT